MYARPISWTTGFNETGRILCTRTLQTSRSPLALPLLLRFPRGKEDGAGGIYSPPSAPTVQTSRQNAAQVFGIWVTRLVSNAVWKRERVVRCHVQWPRDPLTNLSPSWCSKITETRLRSCTNNSSNGSLFYYPSPSLPFPRIGREKGRRQRDSSGKIRVRFKYV